MATAPTIRLTIEETEAIKQAFFEVFGKGQIMLFGSRVDTAQKGGDIDLYLIPQERENLRKKKIDFLIKLDMLIGERKVDVIIAKDRSRLIEQEALTKGVVL